MKEFGWGGVEWERDFWGWGKFGGIWGESRKDGGGVGGWGSDGGGGVRRREVFGWKEAKRMRLLDGKEMMELE